MDKVRLVSITPDAEKTLVYIARVSNPDNQHNPETYKLIKYLIKNKHWSPFEHAFATIEITTSRAIATQILRHRSFSFQEFCITGDSNITLQLPSGATYKRTIEHLYNLQGHPNQYIKHNGLPLVRVFDTNNTTFTTARIQEVLDTGIKPVFEVYLADGKKIKATKEHKFLTEHGFDTLEHIVGLSISGNTATMSKKGIIATNGIPVYQSYVWLKEQKELSITNKTGVQGIASNAGTSYHTIRKWLRIHNLQFTKKETATMYSVWNKGRFGYNTRGHSFTTIEKMRKSARRGIKSNLWKGGVDRTERLKIADWCNTIRAQKLKEADYACVTCGSSTRLELDHIKPVYSNPELAYAYDNIQVLCKVCHDKKHNLSGEHKLWRGCSKGNTLTVRWVEIIGITYVGEQQTYDLHINHDSHNYVANGIVVHNSQRYSEVAALEPIELRRQAIKNRQSSEDVVNPYITALDNTAIQPASEVIDRHLEDSLLLYRRLLDAGVAKETARFVLPLTTQTRLYMSGTIRSWIHYLALRNERHTQKEHQLIAQAIEDILRKELPVTFKALDELNETQRKHEALVATLAERGIFDSDTLLCALLEMPL